MMNEIIAMIETADPAELAGVILASTGLIIFIAAIVLIRYLMQAIGYGKMFKKAGEASWKAWVPFYNIYTTYKISWKGLFFFVYFALATLAKLPIDMPFVIFAFTVGTFVVSVMQGIKMAALFGKGKGTGVALVFFPGITSLILGLGNAEFQGEMIENN